MSIVISVLTTMGMKLLTSAVVEKVVMIALKNLAACTKSGVDDELVAIADKAINGGK